MTFRPRQRIFAILLALALALTAAPAFASGTDSGGSGGGGSGSGGAGGGSGGGGSSSTPCATLSAQGFTSTTYYGTTSSVLGIMGSGTNCASGGLKETIEVTFTDTTTNPACAVSLPSFTVTQLSPGNIASFSEMAGIVPCTGMTHTFLVQETANTVPTASQLVSVFY